MVMIEMCHSLYLYAHASARRKISRFGSNCYIPWLLLYYGYILYFKVSYEYWAKSPFFKKKLTRRSLNKIYWFSKLGISNLDKEIQLCIIRWFNYLLKRRVWFLSSLWNSEGWCLWSFTYVTWCFVWTRNLLILLLFPFVSWQGAYQSKI